MAKKKYPVGTKEAAQIADVSSERASQYARTYGVEKRWNESGTQFAYAWYKSDVDGLIKRKGKRGGANVL